MCNIDDENNKRVFVYPSCVLQPQNLENMKLMHEMIQKRHLKNEFVLDGAAFHIIRA